MFEIEQRRDKIGNVACNSVEDWLNHGVSLSHLPHNERAKSFEKSLSCVMRVPSNVRSNPGLKLFMFMRLVEAYELLEYSGCIAMLKFCCSQFAWLRPLLALLPPGFSISRLPHNETTWSFEKALSCATKVPSPL
ncbi:hypothetical protein P8452_18250 [Trifolium repens]|nr:hypothetical protein P8452_18250 [Trifolium repens]